MKRWGVPFAVAACAMSAGAARADDRFDVTASFLAASGNASPRSPGYPGGELAVARWFGPLGVIAEAGAHTFDWDGHSSWIGAAARLSLGQATHLYPQGGTARGRAWLEAGIAREAWDITYDGIDAHFDRTRTHLGVGADLAAGARWAGGMTVWFRVERGPTFDPMVAAPSQAQWLTAPGTTSLVVGLGVLFGGPA